MSPATLHPAPVFLIAQPAAGARVLLHALRGAAGVGVAESGFLDGMPHHVLRADEVDELRAQAHDALLDALVDEDGRPAREGSGALIGVAGGGQVSRCIPFLAGAFPEARFVFVAANTAQPPTRHVAQLPADRWLRVDRPQLLEQPAGELRRVCAFAGIAYDDALATHVPSEAAPPPPAAPLSASGYASAEPPPPPAGGPEAFASVSTSTFPDALVRAGGSLLISTYQTHRLVCARVQDGGLNTHFRTYDKPMGLAVAPGRIALGTHSEIWDMRDMPAAAAKLEPVGSHDACYLPRNRHVTGDIAVHELGFAGGELWVVATAFSCLATLDAQHSFVPRWNPPFITRLEPGDRCHLNGMAIVDDRVAYVTALGTTDVTGGWREGKASGGVLIDVASSEIVVSGLSMPHSPRWHDGRLWVLESGRGTLCAVDPVAGTVEPIAELPGFTRGLAFAGRTAFVGLSQIRETSTFGDLPITERLSERQCGVWMIDIDTGAITGFLRFEELVQEIFDVALLPGVRFPEIAEAGSEVALRSYELP